VLVTGSSRGLGLVLARQLAGEGARLIICSREVEELQGAQHDLEARGAEVLAVPCNLADHEDTHNLLAQAMERYGHIDVLINNAGTISVGPIEHVTMQDYRHAMDTNFWSAVNIAYHVVPHMQERRSGRIVNVSSIGGKMAVPHLIPYCASKFALVGWSRGLRAELAKDNVIVTTICPGLMRTGSPRHATFQGQNEKEYVWFKYGDSLPGLSVSAEHAATAILDATRRGDAELIIGAMAKVGALADQLMPQMTGELMALAARMLPAPGGIGSDHKTGAESETKATQTLATALTDRASRENNEVLS
jgi:short-subunit dehydrogenase